MRCRKAGCGCAWVWGGWTRSSVPPAPTPAPGGSALTSRLRPCACCGRNPGRTAHPLMVSLSRSTMRTASPSRFGRAGSRSISAAPVKARRAGRVGDGFQPLGLTPDEVRTRVVQMRDAAEMEGRQPDDIEISLSGYLPTTVEDTVAEAVSLGADRLIVSTSIIDDLDKVNDEMWAFAERLGLNGTAITTRDGVE